MSYLIVIVVLSVAVITIYATKYLRTGGEPYNDRVLVENVSCSSTWQEFDVRGFIKFEQDVQKLSVKFKQPFEIDIDGDGGIKRPSGEPIKLEIQLVDANGKVYENLFTGARGYKIAVYSPEARKYRDELYEKLQVRCDSPIEIEKIMWTTYSLRDRK